MNEIETIGQRVKREPWAKAWPSATSLRPSMLGSTHLEVEAGRENPSDVLLVRLAEALNADVDERMLVARRVPDDLMEKLAADPTEALERTNHPHRDASEGSRWRADWRSQSDGGGNSSSCAR